MEAKHTAGPWEAVSNLVRTARTPTGGGILVAECPANIGSRLEDARLIAAAPDMLAALQDAMQLIELVVPFEGDETRKIRKAIAKAIQ
jgi:hypothetical protein